MGKTRHTREYGSMGFSKMSHRKKNIPSWFGLLKGELPESDFKMGKNASRSFSENMKQPQGK